MPSLGQQADVKTSGEPGAATPQVISTVSHPESGAVADIKSLVKAKLSDDLIISHIRNSHTVYHLCVAEIIDLKNSGVSEKVIDFMINTPSSAVAAAPTAYVANTVAAQESTAYVASPVAAQAVEPMVVAPYPSCCVCPWFWWGPWGWYGGWGHGGGDHGYGGRGYGGGGHGR